MHVHGPTEWQELRAQVCFRPASIKRLIYDDGNAGWLLEVVDEFGNSTVWNESFPTDKTALAEALNTIETEGIASVIGSVPTTTMRH